MAIKGLSTGKQIREFYDTHKSEQVNEIISGLYRKVRVANPHPEVHAVMSQDRVLDDLSLLFMGNEKCAAVAFSGNNILISTNEPVHELTSVKYKFSFKKLQQKIEYKDGQPIIEHHIVVICTLFFNDGTALSKESPPVIYHDLPNTGGELRIINVDPKLNFHFAHETLPKGFEKDINLPQILKTGKSPELSLALFQMKTGSIQEWHNPVYLPMNELEKRVLDVLNNLALYAKFYDNFRQFTKETNNPKYQPFKTLIQKDLLKMDCPDVIDPMKFAEGLLSQNKDKFQFSSEGQYFLTTKLVADLFDKMREIKRHNENLNKDFRWPNILSESLTSMLSSLSGFNKLLGDDIVGIDNRGELHHLYIRMVEDYQIFKKAKMRNTSVASVNEWLETLKGRENDEVLKFPLFVKERYNTKDQGFLKNAKRHFIALAYLQEFVRSDAFNQGVFSKALFRESIFEKSAQVKIIDGKADVHAEMRLFDHHLSTIDKSVADYFGISKLCCALCNYTLKQFSASGQRVPRTHGYHAGIFDKWGLLKAFDTENKMRMFLGDDLFHVYDDLKGKSINFSKIEAPYLLSDIVKHLIYRLASINNEPGMKVLKIEGPPMPQPDTLYT